MRYSLFFLVLALAMSCKKTAVVPPEDLPPLAGHEITGIHFRIKVDNVVNGNPLLLGTTSYTTAQSDTFSVNSLKYYLSNICLRRIQGDTIRIPDTYFLVDQADPNSCILTVQNVPEGDYDQLYLMIGVDPLRNTSGAQAGALDPIHGMFWDWNSGYIMARMEGSSPQSGSASKQLAFHIGGYSGKKAGVRDVSLSLPVNMHTHRDHSPLVTLSADLAKWFSGTHAISFATTYNVATVSTASGQISDNYINMLTVTSVVN